MLAVAALFGIVAISAVVASAAAEGDAESSSAATNKSPLLSINSKAQFQQAVARSADTYLLYVGSTNFSMCAVCEQFQTLVEHTADAVPAGYVKFAFLDVGTPKGQSILRHIGVTHMPKLLVYNGEPTFNTYKGDYYRTFEELDVMKLYAASARQLKREVYAKMNHFVDVVTADSHDAFLSSARKSGATPALFFSSKSKPTVMAKVISNALYGRVSLGLVSSDEALAEKYGVQDAALPHIVVVGADGGVADVLTSEDAKKDGDAYAAVVAFLEKHAGPSPYKEAKASGSSSSSTESSNSNSSSTFHLDNFKDLTQHKNLQDFQDAILANEITWVVAYDTKGDGDVPEQWKKRAPSCAPLDLRYAAQ